MIGTVAILNGFKAAAGSWIMHAALFFGLLLGTTSDVASKDALEANAQMRTSLLFSHAILVVTNLIMNYGDTKANTSLKYAFFYCGLFWYLYTLGKIAQ
jgi:hypothetical protein